MRDDSAALPPASEAEMSIDVKPSDLSASTALPEAPAAAAKPVRSRKAILIRVALAAMSVAAAWKAYDYVTLGRFIVSTDDAYVRADMAVLAAKVPGYVNEVLVEDNVAVRAGDLLIRIDDGDYRNALQAAEARLATQQATIERIATQARAQSASIEQANAMLVSTGADTTRTAAEYERATSLAKLDFGSQQRLELTRSDRDKSVALQSSARASVDAARGLLAVLEAQKREAQAQLAEIATTVDKAKRDQSFTEIKAPFDGVVGNRAAQPGQYVQPGTRLLALVPLSSGLCRCQSEGNAARTGPDRPDGRGHHRRDGRASCRRHRRERLARHRLDVLAAAAGECDRQLHQDRAEGARQGETSGLDRRGRQAAPGPLRRRRHRYADEGRVGKTRGRRRRPALGSRNGVSLMSIAADQSRAQLPSAAPAGAVQEAIAPLTTRRVVAFVAMVFGMFMAILDIQIVSASLAEIQAGLSASADEIAWVQTSYLIAEVIMIPLSGLLSRAFSTRYLFVGSAAGFTIMSVLCATATSIEQMIVWRALQGFIGGAMIPTVFATAFSIFPKDKQPVVSPVIGLVATLAPTIGPTIGGYLTELFSWHWLFLVNVLPGIVVSFVTWTFIDFDKPDTSIMKRFDWIGLVSMAGFLGALEYVLEEGPSKDWLDSEPVTICLAVSLVCSAVFFWRAVTAPQPIVDLGAFRDRNFWSGSLFSFVLGVGLYGLTYLYPVYLARVRGYSALQIGETMFLSGICMFVTAPIAGRLMRVVDPRLMMVAGFTIFGLGTWLASDITKDWAFGNLVLPQILRGVGIMLCMIPITNTSLGTLPPDRLKNASGLFNLMRNLGGAFGLALINTTINKRLDLHLARLQETVSWGRNAAEETLANITLSLAPLGSDAEMAAIAKLGAIVRREATVMAIGDVFYALTFLFLLVPLLIPLMRKPAPPPPGAAPGH